MKPHTPTRALAGAVLSLAAATACTATSTTHPAPSGAPPHTTKDTEQAPGSCPQGPSQPLPKQFPAHLPIPQDAVVTSVERRSHGRLVVATVVRGGFHATLTFLQQQLPKAGYTLKDGEVEEHDAESNFSSPTVQGRWTLRTMPHCPGGVYLTYLTATTT